jgi:cell division protein FtsB
MSNFKKLITNRWFIIGGSGFILLLLIVQVRQYRTRRQVEKEIGQLSTQADQIQKNNQDLQNMIAYLKTDSYKEKTAREQLSLRKEGETVYSFSAAEAQAAIEEKAAEIAKQQAKQSSNPSKWWNYFFKAE